MLPKEDWRAVSAGRCVLHVYARPDSYKPLKDHRDAIAVMAAKEKKSTPVPITIFLKDEINRLPEGIGMAILSVLLQLSKAGYFSRRYRLPGRG